MNIINKRKIVFAFFLFPYFVFGQQYQLSIVNTASQYSSNGKFNGFNTISYNSVSIDQKKIITALIIKDLNKSQETFIKEGTFPYIEYQNWFDSSHLIFIENYIDTNNIDTNNNDTIVLRKINLYNTENMTIESINLDLNLSRPSYNDYPISSVGKYLIFNQSTSKKKFIRNFYLNIINEKIYSFDILSHKIKCIKSRKKYQTGFIDKMNLNSRVFEWYYFKGNKIKKKKILVEYPKNTWPFGSYLIDGEYLYYTYLDNDTNFLIKYDLSSKSKKIIGKFDKHIEIFEINSFKENYLLLTIANTIEDNAIEIDTSKTLNGLNIGISGQMNLYLYKYGE